MEPAKLIAPVVVLGIVGGIAIATKDNDDKPLVPTTASEIKERTLPTRSFVAPKEIPGTVNHNVTQRTIRTTICVRGWTKTIRPPSSYTTSLKIRQMVHYHLEGTTKDYEEDHLIPLEIGGHPTDPRNLWPEPHPRSFVVDKIENFLKRQVCKGLIKLRAARNEIKAIKHING